VAAYYRTVVEADSVPIRAANQARAALGMPLLAEIVPTQKAALRDAEAAELSGTANPDSVLRLYSAVIAIDSTSREGRRALFAKAYICENQSHQIDTARAIYGYLLKQYPDSSYATWLKIKLAPPDSASVFFLSDADLTASKVPAAAILEMKPDENGWPPPEESLRGRRFR
jgi:hypothetical protein